MSDKDFRRIALGMENAVESAHMGHPDFRVNNKVFATIHQDRQWGMVKLTTEQQKKFVKEDPRTFVPENGAWGRAGCTKVRLESVSEDTLGEAMTLAWQNTVNKAAAVPSKPRRTAKPARPPRKRT